MLTGPRDQVEAKCRELANRLGKSADESELQALILDLGQLRDQRALDALVAARRHPRAVVRRAVAEALPMAMVNGHQSAVGVAALIDLSVDVDPEVRDWATCSLGRTLATDADDLSAFYDTPQVRSALTARLSDPDPATRAEACAGLALRGVEAVVEPLRRELGRRDVGRVPVLAAEALGSAELYDSLVALRQWWTRDPALLERAISSCKPFGVTHTGSRHDSSSGQH
jgi:HEAT repeat protein